MSEAATRWVSPYWNSVNGRPLVHILNPGPSDAWVAVRWVDFNGTLLEEETPTGGPLSAGVCWLLDSGGPYDVTQGWGYLLVLADQPVIPWGVTAIDQVLTGAAPPRQHVAMGFYRAEVNVPATGIGVDPFFHGDDGG